MDYKYQVAWHLFNAVFNIPIDPFIEKVTSVIKLFLWITWIFMQLLMVIPRQLFPIIQKIFTILYTFLLIIWKRFKMIRYAAKIYKCKKIEYSKLHYSNQDIILMEEWFLLNSGKKLSNDSLNGLAEKTNLSKVQIKSWMYKRRKKDLIAPENSDDVISIHKTKMILNNFFMQNQYPNDAEITSLKFETGLEKKKIRSFFNMKRFLLKKKNSI